MPSRSIAQGINGKLGEYLIARTYRTGLGEVMRCASGNADKRTGQKLLMKMQVSVHDRPSVWVHV